LATKCTFQILYIDAWYSTVTQAENTPSTTTVDVNMTQRNPTPKLVTQVEMNAKHSKIVSDQVFKMSFTSFHTSSSAKIWSPQPMLGNDV